MSEILNQEPVELARTLLELHGDESTWLDAFAEVLDRGRAGRELERILEVWGLNQSDAARLFGVTRQAVSKWLAKGAPSDRVEAIADLAAATDLMVRHLKRDRIPAVVRRPAEALQGQSLLELASRLRTRDVLEACRSMFAFPEAQS